MRSPSPGHCVSYLVTWWHPSSFLDELLSVLVNLWRSLRNLINGRLLPSSSTLNIAQSLLQTPQFNLNLALGLLSILQRDLLEALDGLYLLADIIGFRLETLVVLLDLIDHLCVLQNASVVLEVHCDGSVIQLGDTASGIIVSFLEVRKG